MAATTSAVFDSIWVGGGGIGVGGGGVGDGGKNSLLLFDRDVAGPALGFEDRYRSCLAFCLASETAFLYTGQSR